MRIRLSTIMPVCPAARAVAIGAVALSALTAPTAAASGAPSSVRLAVTGSAADAIPGANSAASAPHAVPPVVTDLGVPAVAGKDRAATTAKIAATSAGTAPGRGVLVAHLRARLGQRFSMVGVTWDVGTASAGTTVAVRTHTGTTWSDWTQLDIDNAEGPSAAEDSIAKAGTAPAWVGSAAGVEVAVYSPTGVRPQHLAVSAINPGTSSYDAIATTTASATTASATTSTSTAAGSLPALPTVITRQQWGADPSLGDACWDPIYGKTFSMVFVHHTAGSNNYSESESAAVVRGIYAYHTQSRGWCDIGYNFLVDRYGNIFEGRRGGIRMPVRGSHAGDYNVDTTGISLMGDFTSTSPTRSMKHSLVRLIAWRMGTAYHGAYGHAWVNGTRFKRISGHRDAMSTTCPGQRAYDWLPTLRQRVAAQIGGSVSPIEARWRTLGGMSSRLGPVSIGEQPENGGWHTAFQNGRMYLNPSGGRNTLYQSRVLKRYVSIGETGSSLGYPTSNLRSIVAGRGITASFGGGRIYSSPATGPTVLVRSAILKRYLAEGSAAGPLGFPTVRVHSTPTGAMANFQHGSIAYVTAQHRTVVTFS